MTQATHTPGPWELTFGEYDAAIHAGATIAMVDDTMRAWKENARLIAAAPDLLAALERAYQKLSFWMDDDKWDHGDENAMVQIWDAITKAKGE